MKPAIPAPDGIEQWPEIHNELDLISGLVALAKQRLLELGCGAAQLARELVVREPSADVTCLESDLRQHELNLTRSQQQLHFVWGRAEALEMADGSFDGALMLKSLHHIPRQHMGQALSGVARVLRPGGWLYVSEPVYAGAFNELVRRFNDEREVRMAAQQALDQAVASGRWRQVLEHHYVTPVRYRDWADFEARMLQVSYAEYPLSDETSWLLRQRFESQLGPDGVHFKRPMHARLLRLAAPQTRSG